MTRRIRSRYLVGYVIAWDLALFAGVIPLERYALDVAASPSSSALLIFALLLVNVLLLLGVVAAVLASCGLGVRVAARVFRRGPFNHRGAA